MSVWGLWIRGTFWANKIRTRAIRPLAFPLNRLRYSNPWIEKDEINWLSLNTNGVVGNRCSQNMMTKHPDRISHYSTQSFYANSANRLCSGQNKRRKLLNYISQFDTKQTDGSTCVCPRMPCFIHIILQP
jgi:hypothetical protein